MGCLVLLVVLLVWLTPTALAEEEVKLTIVAEGLPQDVNAKVYINQTAIPFPLNGSSREMPIVLSFRKGTRVEIDTEDRVQGSWGTIYVRKGVFIHGTSNAANKITLDSDITVVGRYEWSHFLLQPMLWPFYAITMAIVLLLLVRRRYGGQGKATENESETPSERQ